MQLSKHNARQIVAEINSVMQQKINIIDKGGIIIASSDPERAGSYHGGAAALLEQDLDELVISDGTDYEGSQQGTNFPLCVEGEKIGVLGITGPYEEIYQSAQIIKKMTELLVKEKALQQRAIFEEQTRNRYLEEWLSREEHQIDRRLAERGLALAIDITLPRRILVFLISSEQPEAAIIHDINQAEKYIQKKIHGSSSDNLFFKSGQHLVCAVTDSDDQGLYSFITNIKGFIEKQYSVTLTAGIGEIPDLHTRIRSSYRQALKALQSSLKTKGKPVRFYQDLTLEIFSADLPDLTKIEFVRRIFFGFTFPQIQAAVPVLEALFQYDGSITEAAEALFIHKNTLQNRLRRIAERTGYDPRSLSHCALFYTALHFYYDVRGIIEIESR